MGMSVRENVVRRSLHVRSDPAMNDVSLGLEVHCGSRQKMKSNHQPPRSGQQHSSFMVSKFYDCQRHHHDIAANIKTE